MTDYLKAQQIAHRVRQAGDSLIEPNERLIVLVVGDDGGYRLAFSEALNISTAVGVLTRAAGYLDRAHEGATATHIRSVSYAVTGAGGGASSTEVEQPPTGSGGNGR